MCSIPHEVLQKKGHQHEPTQCKWSDTIMNVTWGVVHSQKLLQEMKQVIPCDTPLLTERSTRDEVLLWFKWLASIAQDQQGCNMHRLWIWFFDNKILPVMKRAGAASLS